MTNSASRNEREEIEKLASTLHEVYMKEATRQGDVRHAEDYNELPERIKEFDRALARWILADRRRCLEEIEKPLKKFRLKYKDMIWEIEKEQLSHLKAIDEALALIEKEKGNVWMINHY